MKKWILLFVFVSFVYYCNQKKFHKNFNDINIFPDGFQNIAGLKFFDLLDDYPVLKRAVKSVKPEDFNSRLNKALQQIHERDINGSLRAIQFILLEERNSLQSTLITLANVLNRFRTGDKNSYDILTNYLERLRNYPKAIIRGIIPFSGEFLMKEYRTYDSETIKNKILSFVNELRTQNVKDLLIKTENIAFKGLTQNSNVRSGLEEVLNGVSDPSLLQDKSVTQNLVQIVYGLGDMMIYKAGFNDFKSPETVFKELIINLEKYNTVGGANYTSEYSNLTYSSELEQLFVDLFNEIKKLIITPTSLTKDSTSSDDNSQPITLLSEWMKNYALLSFTKDLTGLDESLKNLIQYDFKNRDRSYSNNGSSQISALESLFFLLSVVDAYGYNWHNSGNCNTTPNTNCNWITGATGGILTIGDTLWSMQSVIHSSDAFNFKNILNLNSESRSVFKNNVELSTHSSSNKPVNINTYVLRLLEKESIGAAPPIESNTANNIYIKTIPWVLNWMVKILYQGYGPYFNKNKKDTNGNYLAPDGSIYIVDSLNPNAKYKSEWTTADYKICLEKNGSVYRWVGLGGRESDGVTIPHPTGNCTTGLTPPSSDSWRYTIKEIPKSDLDRAVETDEEAFYKNFQWLLYEKRFVVIIPARAKLHSSVPFEEALFILAIGNGLKGMMNLKPNCGPNNIITDCGNYNGVWNSDVSSAKTLTLKQYDQKNVDLQVFSNVPGDSVLLLEGWGYGSSGTEPNLVKTLVLPTLVYPLLIPSPTEVFGLIPPVISQHFDVLERLGFFVEEKVKPSQTSQYWDRRNKLTPLIAALAKTLDDQVDVINNKNPYTLLINLSKILARPYYFETSDPTSFDSSLINPTYTSPPTVPQLRIVGMSSSSGLRSPSMTSGEYLPRSNLRSVISLLSENNRKFQDGVLNLVGKTSLLTGLGKFLASLGNPEKVEARKKIISGLRKIAEEIKLTADSPTQVQYNLQTYLQELRNRIAAYPDTRSNNLNSSDWDGVNDSVAFFRDYFSSTSEYSLTKSLDFILIMLSDIPPSSEEITAFLNVVTTLLTDENGNQNYRLTNILTHDLPDMIEKIAPYGRNMYAMLGSLGKPDGYIAFLENNMSYVPHSVKELLIDVERILRSEMIQRKIEDEHSLLYSAGKLIQLFADIHQFGRKIDPYGFPFADNLNVDDTSPFANYWNRLNMIFSSKK